MAFLSVRRPHFELLALRRHLEEGTMSSTDAARQAGEIVFDSSTGFEPTEKKSIWRDYDEAIRKATVEMLEKLTKY